MSPCTACAPREPRQLEPYYSCLLPRKPISRHTGPCTADRHQATLFAPDLRLGNALAGPQQQSDCPDLIARVSSPRPGLCNCVGRPATESCIHPFTMSRLASNSRSQFKRTGMRARESLELSQARLAPPFACLERSTQPPRQQSAPDTVYMIHSKVPFLIDGIGSLRQGW